jgi:hypothetical protein
MLRAPVIAVCHGGGPMPLLGDKIHENLVASMKRKIPKLLGLDDKGKNEKGLMGIVVVTAHVSSFGLIVCLDLCPLSIQEKKF